MTDEPLISGVHVPLPADSASGAGQDAELAAAAHTLIELVQQHAPPPLRPPSASTL